MSNQFLYRKNMSLGSEGMYAHLVAEDKKIGREQKNAERDRVLEKMREREIREQQANARYDDLRLARDDYEEPKDDPREGSF